MMTDGSGARPRRVFWLNVGIVCSDAGAVQIGFDQPATLFQLEPVEAVEIADNRWFELIVGTDTLQRFDFTLKKGGDFTLDLTPR